MTKTSRIENIRIEIERGGEAWEEATVLLERSLAKGALSRLYYCLFHHIKALLFSLGLESKTHEGTVHLFNLHFVKKGIFPSHSAKLLSRLQKYRELADYDPACVFSIEDVTAEMKEVGTVILRIKEYLGEKGLLKDTP
jgi:uncharacterized protein